MMKFLWPGLLLLWVYACHSKKAEENKDISSGKAIPDKALPGSALAVKYCSSCHLYVSPNQLPKPVWEKKVLPMMGFRLGIFDGPGPPDSLFEEGKARQLVQKANIYPLTPSLPREDWEKIVAYILTHAPDAIPLPVRESPIQMGLPHFKYRKSEFSKRPPLCTMVKIMPEQSEIAFSDGKRNVSSLNILNQKLEKKYDLFMKTTPIDYQWLHDTLYLTTVGRKVFPSDHAEGIIEKVYNKSPTQPPNAATILIDNLQRPVHVTYADLNLDGRTDILVCDFGNLLGKLAWYENKGRDTYVMHLLKKDPGASATVITDVNQDGRPDIIALMAQGDEGIFLFKNSAAGFLKGEPLLRFSPLSGSTYFEMADFNGDGHQDIIYTCGDNADLSPLLKDYHGIYIFLNDGNFKFKKAWFYQLNGAYKALARDYDLDGDLDIAAISFFPDYARSPEEGFVYLENRGALNFTAYSFPEVTDGRWLVMDANDIDQDGDIDIALGSFVSFYPEGDTTGLYDRWIKESPSVVLLENTVKHE